MSTHEERIQDLERRMSASEHERLSLIELIQANNKAILEIRDDTQELRELWSEARSAFRFFTRCVAVARWVVKFIVLPVGFVLAALYAWAHEGRAPSWIHTLTDLLE